MRQSIIILFSVLFILNSCTKGRIYNSSAYLEVKNLTSHQVTISFYDTYSVDTSLVKQYFVSPNFDGYLDTAKFEYVIESEDDYCKVLTPNSAYSGCGEGSTYYWGIFSSVAYKFENVKITPIIDAMNRSTFESCDTSSQTKLCIITDYDRQEEFIDRRNSQVTEIVTYYITEQQYLLADSI